MGQADRTSAGKARGDLLQGTLDMLVLQTLALEPMHGWGICERICEMSEDVLRINQGSLYPALQRLARRGLVTSAWRTTANNRRARYYELTTAGRHQLDREVDAWRRSATAIERVLDRAGQES